MRAIATVVASTFLLGCSPSSDRELEPEPRGAAGTSGPGEHADVDRVLAALRGDRRHAGGEEERAALRRAVDGIVAQMGFLARGVARRRLLASNAIPERLRIDGDANRLTIAFDDRVYTATVGGPAVEVIGITGDALSMTLRVQDDAVVQRFEGPSGVRTNRILRRDGRLKVEVEVRSESLPEPLLYALTYASTPSPGS